MSHQWLDTIVANYRLTDLLGAGGMGAVYRGTHVQTGHVVAVKILSADAIEARDLARFYHEARVHAGLIHPNIVRLQGLVSVEGRPCLLLEYVDGELLADRISRLGRLAPEEALGYLRDVARGVAYAHAAGVVHRDIKPSNIRMTADGVVKLLDFGIAQSAAGAGLTQVGRVIGSLHYLSPEQLLGERVTAASDVWALGVLLYQMVTGVLPFKAQTANELMAAIASATYTAPSTVVRAGQAAPALIGAVDTLVQGCLVRDPSLRTPSATQVVNLSSAAIEDGPRREPEGPRVDAAQPVAWLQPRWNIVSRAWIWPAAGAFLLIFVVFVLSGSNDVPAGQEGVVHIGVTNHEQADVYVNGHYIGVTPRDFNGRVGDSIEVELRRNGFETRRTQVSISPDTTATLTLEASRTTP